MLYLGEVEEYEVLHKLLGNLFFKCFKFYICEI